MASEVSICNQALGWVGGRLITSLEDASTEAQLCKANYTELRLAVLSDSLWHFARKTYVASVPEAFAVDEWNEYSFKFLLPADVILVRNVYADSQGKIPAEWIVQAGRIYSNSAQIFYEATVDVVSAQLMPPTFRQALAARLSMDLAIPIAQSRTLQQDMANLYTVKLDEAAGIDAQQGPRKLKTQSRLNGARFGTLG